MIIMNVSIIIPCYNSEKTIKECLDSILRDSAHCRHKTEIIVVDDGSTDNTKKIVCDYDSVKYIYIDNMGPATARNRGANEANHEILLFTNSDCIVQPGWINHLTDSFIKYPLISAVKGSSKTRQGEIIPLFCQLEYMEKYRLMERQRFIDNIDSYSSAFKKDSFLEIGGFNESFPYPQNDDVDLSYRMALYNKLMVFNPNACVIRQYKTKAWEFFKEKFGKAYWRSVVYNKYPEKIIRNISLSNLLRTQVIFINLIFISLFLTLFWAPSFNLFILSSIIFILSCIPTSITALRFSFRLFIFSYPMLFLRAIILNLGFIASLFPINLDKLISAGLIIIDTLTIITSVFISYLISSFILYGTFISSQLPIENYLYAIPVVVILYMLILQTSSLYHAPKDSLGVSYIFKIFSSSLVLVLSLASLSYLFYLDYSRTLLILLFPTTFTISIILRMFWFKFTEFLIRSGYGLKRAIIIGINNASKALVKKMSEHIGLGYRFIGFISRDNKNNGKDRVIGSIESLPNIIKSFRINEVFFADQTMPTERIFEIISESSSECTSFKVVTSTFDILIKAVDIDSIASIPLIDLKNQPISIFYIILKRFFDLLFAILFLIIFLIPFLLGFLILNFLSSDSAFNRKIAKGYKERKFYIHTLKISHLRNNGFIKNFLYLFLSKTRLYIYPMLFNIILGNMSFVGPEPTTDAQPGKMKKWQKLRYNAIPGITGIAQIMKKSDNIRDLEYDFYYLRNRSLILDFSILIKAVIYLFFKVL